MLSQQIVEK